MTLQNGRRPAPPSNIEQLRALRARLDLAIQREEAAASRTRRIAAEVAQLTDPLPVGKPEKLHIKTVTMAAADHFFVPPNEIFGGGRTRKVAQARAAVAWVLRDSGKTFTNIGQLLSRDHTTIMAACRRVETTPDLHAAALTIRARVKGAA